MPVPTYLLLHIPDLHTHTYIQTDRHMLTNTHDACMHAPTLGLMGKGRGKNILPSEKEKKVQRRPKRLARRS